MIVLYPQTHLEIANKEAVREANDSVLRDVDVSSAHGAGEPHGVMPVVFDVVSETC